MAKNKRVERVRCFQVFSRLAASSCVNFCTVFNVLPVRMCYAILSRPFEMYFLS